MTGISNWQHIRTITDGERFEINGLNIWDHDWKTTGEKIQIKDPLYRQDFTFSVYQINNDQNSAQFAAGEFSNGVWGVYIKSY